MASSDKYLVHLLSSIDSKHLFGLVWVGIGAFFVSLFYLNYRKATRRNFRGPEEIGVRPRVDLRQLPDNRPKLPQKRE